MPAHGLCPQSPRLGRRENRGETVENSGETVGGRRGARALIGTRLRKRVRDETVLCSGGASGRRRLSCLANGRRRAATCWVG